jgi:hypothetical protein
MRMLSSAGSFITDIFIWGIAGVFTVGFIGLLSRGFGSFGEGVAAGVLMIMIGAIVTFIFGDEEVSRLIGGVLVFLALVVGIFYLYLKWKKWK